MNSSSQWTTLSLRRMESKTMAEFSRVEHVEALREVDGKWAVKDEDGNIVTLEHEEFIDRYSPTAGYICGICGNYIDKYNDLYYYWNETDYSTEYICEICGQKEGSRPVSVLGRLHPLSRT